MLLKYLAFLALVTGISTQGISQKFTDALQKKDTVLAASLLKKGYDINSLNDNSSSALLDACREPQADTNIVGFLLRHGAKVDYPVTKMGRTPLIVACAYYGDVALCRMLINWGADVNAVTKDGVTALMKAADIDKSDVVAYLLSKGANATLRDAKGRTALDYAKASTVDNFLIKMMPTCKVDKDATIALLTNTQ
ncbi:MAG TPA: ankyrin repeat domain-containing protein [Chitinophagaceae bacterium]|nr:ankyrin repeat domain-containing protein [Chitinophagaceae bacterium]